VPNFSELVAQQIDEEIRVIIDANYQRAEKLLQENISVLHNMAKALMKWETIDKTQIDALMFGKEPLPHPEFPTPNLEKIELAKNSGGVGDFVSQPTMQ